MKEAVNRLVDRFIQYLYCKFDIEHSDYPNYEHVDHGFIKCSCKFCDKKLLIVTDKYLYENDMTPHEVWYKLKRKYI